MPVEAAAEILVVGAREVAHLRECKSSGLQGLLETLASAVHSLPRWNVNQIVPDVTPGGVPFFASVATIAKIR